MDTHVRLPDDLAEWLTQYADDNYMSKNAVIIKALKELRSRKST